MKKALILLPLLLLLVVISAWSAPPSEVISTGLQPQPCMDNKGVIRVVFGRSDSIFCSTSNNKGKTFAKPVFIGQITGMHLGMTRGPQIASSANYSVVTAMDKSGNIHFFQLTHTSNQWTYKGKINDIPSSAPEGLMSIAADTKDNFYAVWLDIRQDEKNNICFSSLSGKEGKWEKNKLIYISPDKHVCECCKPSIDVQGSKVVVMYRNWLNGSRDLYVMTSDNEGKTFKEAEKLGFGTWKLNGCPMDGGGISMDHQGTIHTVWQREGTVYFSKPNEREVELVKGRSCSLVKDLSNSKKQVVSFQDGKEIKIIDLNSKKVTTLGQGAFLKPLMVSQNELLCVWEQDKNILFKKVSVPL